MQHSRFEIEHEHSCSHSLLLETDNLSNSPLNVFRVDAILEIEPVAHIRVL